MGSTSFISGPRLFTTTSVRTILHNSFYAGQVKYNDQSFVGLHEPLVSGDNFTTVQQVLRKNSGRSETLHPRPERNYLLKGLIRCAYCGMPMWSQTYKNGNRYYREHHRSRGLMECPSGSGSVICEVADEQVGRLVNAIALETDWIDQIIALIQLQDEVKTISESRRRVEERLRRLGKAYVNGVYADSDFEREKRSLEMQLESLVVPEVNAATEAGRLLEQLPELWEAATLEERRGLLLAMLDGVYFDAKEAKAIVAIRPKPAFQIAVTKEGSNVTLIKNEPPNIPLEGGMCFWWRRGGVEPPVQKTSPRDVLQA